MVRVYITKPTYIYINMELIKEKRWKNIPTINKRDYEKIKKSKCNDNKKILKKFIME